MRMVNTKIDRDPIDLIAFGSMGLWRVYGESI